MEESYIKTGHELIQYWTRILSVAIKRQATSTNILWNLGAVKNEEFGIK